MSERWDSIVIGLGGMGSAAALELARRGQRVLGFEQHHAAHDRGSSHGESRIIRQCYFEHPDYVPLLLRAYDGWHRLEQEVARQLYFPVGLLISGPAGGEAVSGARLAAGQHSLELEELSLAEAARRFPIFDLPADHAAVFEPNAGYLLVDDCVRAQWAAARAAGADLRETEPVRSWSAEGDHVVVRTDRAEYRAERLVIAAGAWAGQVLADLKLPLTVARKVAAWFPAPAAQAGHESRMPTFYIEQPEGAFYGFPSLDGQTIKVAEHTGAEPVSDPAAVNRTVAPADLVRIEAFLRQTLPSVSTAVDRSSVCLYTLSPDHHFLIDRHPAHPQVVFAAGFSGHGFKFCPVVGEALADLALEGRTDLPIGFLGLQRLR